MILGTCGSQIQHATYLMTKNSTKVSEACFEPSQTSMMEHFARIVKG